MAKNRKELRAGLLIFDLDGTLIDSETDLTLSVNATRQQLALPPLPSAVIASYVGQGVVMLVRRALGEEAAQEEIEKGVGFFLDYYQRHMLDHTVAYPGVSDALDALRDRTLTVLTNKPVNFSRGILEGLRLAPYFSFVYGGNSFDQKKPDPAGVFRLMRDTGQSPSETMIIGDSETDVQTGRNAGIWTCGVTYGIGSASLAKAAPDFMVDELGELPRLLNGLGSGTSRRVTHGD